MTSEMRAQPADATGVNLASAPLVRASNDASILLNELADPRAAVTTLQGAVMADPTGGAAAGLLAKLLPAGIGAALMIAVDTPSTKREWFVRIFVAFVCSWAFYGFTFDLLKSLSWLSFMDRKDEDHQFAVRALLGAGGWFVLGGGAQLLRRWKSDPLKAIEDGKKAVL